MGHVRVKVVNPVQRDRSVVVESALVDNGATRTTIPRSIANELDLDVVGQGQVRTADGVHVLDHSFALVRYEGLETIGDVWISDGYPGVLIGVITLESLGLMVDPVSGRLITSEFLLL
jgi:clan AA aspartic protease